MEGLTFMNIEPFIVYAVMAILFVTGFRKKDVSPELRSFTLDRQLSNAMKGLACVLVLVSHHRLLVMAEPGDVISKAVSYLCGIICNMGLVWFMAISGYGLTVSSSGRRITVAKLLGRYGKILFPVLFAGAIASLLFMVFNPHSSLVASYRNWNEYWYVWCILAFYMFFYLSLFIEQKYGLKKTYTLFAMLVAWYFATYFILGPSLQHYYRFTWAFFFGHVLACRDDRSAYALCAVSLLTFINQDYLGISSFVAGIGTMILASWLDKRYAYSGKIFLFLGSISYFFYLSHIRIGWVLENRLGTGDLIVWILVTILVSYTLDRIYKLLSGSGLFGKKNG